MLIQLPRYQNESRMLRRIQSLCQRVSPALLQKVDAPSLQIAIERGVFTVQELLKGLALVGVKPTLIEPGFGPGHIARLYANALVLCSSPDLTIEPAHRFIGLVAGTLHKMGLVVANRYDEKGRRVGYAEVSGLVVADCFTDCKLGNRGEADLLAYGIGAQTHYGAAVGAESRRQSLPYVDVFNDLPFWCVWLARWCNRLDCVGPGFFVRHLLSRAKSLQPGHVDFMQNGFYQSEFASHMVPSLEAAAGHTMLRHLENFRATQVNTSMYGKHDCGVMLELREAQKGRTARIIVAVQKPLIFSAQQEEEILDVFGRFMIALDGSDAAPAAIARIFSAFSELPETTRHPWLAGFLQTIQEYLGWREEMRERLECLPADWLNLPGICDSITDYFRPDPEWCQLLQRHDWTF